MFNATFLLIMWQHTSLSSTVTQRYFSLLWSGILISFMLLLICVICFTHSFASMQTGGSVWHGALTFIHNTLLCFHERSEHSYHPICFQSGSLRRLTVHTLLPRQTGGLSERSEVCEPCCWEKRNLLFWLFCLPLVDFQIQRFMQSNCKGRNIGRTSFRMNIIV